MLNKWEAEQGQRVCAFDIDGVLNYYPKTWVDYLNRVLNANFKDLNEAKRAIPYKTYKDLKWAYRESGEKAHLEVRAGAKEVLDRLHNMGYQILILTSRPFKEHKTLFKQTVDWLNAAGLHYDGIIFGEEKYVEVLTQAPGLRFLVDDHHYYCQSVSRWGYHTFLVNTTYNQGAVLPNVHRITELEEIFNYDFV